MDTEEFRVRGKQMIDYICDYMNTIKTRRVVPSVEPGYLRRELPAEAPQEPESWENIMADVEKKIMPGVTHWQHPRFHAYFPSGNSYPSILGDMLSAAIACIGFSWAASPACTELEIIVLNWLGKAIGLPSSFLTLEEGSKGGGVIEGSASECVFVVMLAARANAIKRLKRLYPCVDEGCLLTKLIAYCSKDAHSCVEKAAMMCFIKLRILQPDDKGRLRGEILKQAMEEDEESGRVPFFVSITLGTTSCCAFDALSEIGPVVSKFPSVWLHVDGAYAGGGFLCPELKYLLKGIEYADSFNTNANKWLLVNFDCSLLWVRDRFLLTSALVVDPLYLQHSYDHTAIDYRHWGIALSRRFRSLKLWFVLRTFGISGLQQYIRQHIRLAKYFEMLVKQDSRFEVCNDVKMGLVCFRLIGSGDELEDKLDKMNKLLLSNLNASGRIHMVPALVRESYVIRFCVVAQHITKEDIDYSWDVITEFANEILEGSDKQEEMTAVKRTLAHKRSFFVRMVSDPKIYNPGIAKTGSLATPPPPITPDNAAQVNIYSTSKDNTNKPKPTVLTSPDSSPSTWISWPLGFFFQSGDNESNNDHLSIRFRHLDTLVRLKTPGGRRGSTPSPERSQQPQ